ncbi:MAG: 3-dehydroquinate synthase [Candidatus Omnitrophica bacterium]|nr:3-dehydroquinate synthase [Candidatus Omnitrophota bacterium]
MKIVKVNLGERSYNICIGTHVINRLPFLLKLNSPPPPIFVITNKRIRVLHGPKLQKLLNRIGEKILFHEIPDSETAKSFPVYIKTIKVLSGFAKKAKPLIFAFGGGVVGDLAGFVASAYKRGVPYVQIPTTLLGQVDSAIGGKVAIDIQEAKNIVGNFYQPKMVLCDLAFLRTLPEKEIRNGLVEVVKYGIIKDMELFLFLEKNVKEILRLNKKILEYIIFKSCFIKAKVVAKDEFDIKDARAILNFGHTIGHAVEAASRYAKSVTHGHAVALGMIASSLIALRLGILRESDCTRISALVQRVAPRGKIKGLRLKAIIDALSYDKKFIYGENRFILPEKIGKVKIVDGISDVLIKEVIEKILL